MNIKFLNRLIKILVFSCVIIVSSCIDDNTIDRKISTPTTEKNNLAEQSDISGVWNLNNKVSNAQLSVFDDKTWKRISVTKQNDTLIRKGKYTLAQDSAVFFRYFGMQHIPNSDTINDYKTSLGAFVLFINENGDLEDNQEDYNEIYVKVN